MRNNLFEKKTSEVKYRWDEENRLLGVDENGFVSHYLYDANGMKMNINFQISNNPNYGNNGKANAAIEQ
ncbi:MAG: hypothetical protein J6N73_02030 [Prevotella sp.]|nr:hypothetical protein [Prevotella sp.]